MDIFSWSLSKQQDELIKQAAEIRLVNEAYKSETPKKSGLSRFLALLSKELACLGFSLELRLSSQPEPQANLSQQGDVGGCA